ncbi:hypothetical protein [Tropicibacter sp. Alg240-R139]|uniref:hypothetical protein n=1 Tax=Tropicibacter sp. Alg240-R139 TaxID=2305991 RepID=UPI0013E08F4E|nr:hypothetical protein [Tropicibacter sp. Alg240-R139]
MVVDDNLHVWIADTQTPKNRKNWDLKLGTLKGLIPGRIIPGHYLGDVKFDHSALGFTRQYVTRFEGSTATPDTAEEPLGVVTEFYPDFPITAGLGRSAKVIMGEASWP